MPSSTRSPARAKRSPRATGACDLFEGRFSEVLIIFVLALVVLGPEKLPRVVGEIGRWVGRARAMARQFREQLEEEVQVEQARRAQSAAAQSTPPPAQPAEAAAPPPAAASTEPPPPFHGPTPPAPTMTAAATAPKADERGS
jgi:sec-independent protein translocase protein TatB